MKNYSYCLEDEIYGWDDEDQMVDGDQMGCKDIWDTMIDEEPLSLQDFRDLLNLLLPMEEVQDGLWDILIIGMRRKQKKLKGLKGHTLREAIEVDDEDLD